MTARQSAGSPLPTSAVRRPLPPRLAWRCRTRTRPGSAPRPRGAAQLHRHRGGSPAPRRRRPADARAPICGSWRYISWMRMAAAAALAIALSAIAPTLAGAQSADAIDAPRISMQDFKKLLAAKNVVVVDTRNAEEFKA